QQIGDPLIGKFTACDSGHVIGLRLLVALEPFEKPCRELLWDHDDPVRIADDEIAGVHDDPAALNWIVHFTGASVQRPNGSDSSRVHGEVELQDSRKVANVA